MRAFRLAVVSDIHGNIDALEAVIRRIDDLGCDEVWDLGDCLSGPLDAAATADRLIRLNWRTVRGNHDRHLVDRPAGQMGLSDRAAYAQLAAHHLDWLRTLPQSRDVKFNGLRVHAMHATPASDHRYLLETVEPAGVTLAPPAAIAGCLQGIDADIVLTGHSHIPRLASIPGITIVNPGSVGLQAYDDDQPHLHYMETGSPHARFATLDFHDGRCEASFHAVAYDPRRAAELARRNGRDGWAQALATGYALRQ